MSQFYKKKKVLVTGAAGFIAGNLINKLVNSGAEVRGTDISPKPGNFNREADYFQANLLSREECGAAVKGMDYVFHLASVGWGFHENLKRQPQILTDNLALNSNMLDISYKSGIARYLFTSSAAVYPGYLEEMGEDAPWDEPPHGSEKYYAWSKRMGEIQTEAYYEHHKFPVSIVRLFNPYGPGDNFHPEKSHVIPALIRRAAAGENPFTVWGSGKPVRSFIYVDDVVRGMLTALEKLPTCRPVNLASKETSSIRDVVKTVLELTGQNPEIVYQTDKPDGHPRRIALTQRAEEELGMREYVPLREGLKKAIDWYFKNKS